MPELIITADDCGMSEGINHATLDLHQQGYVTSASVMANFPAFRHALELFGAHPTLEIGAHLTLTQGEPISDDIPDHVPILKKSGEFHTKYNLFSRLLMPTDETILWIRHELDAQMGKFVSAGVQPAHITTHHHFHTIPALRNVTYDLAKRYDVKWVRAHEFRATIAPYNLFPAVQTLPKTHPFEIPAFLSPLRAWMGRSAGEYVDKLLALEGTIEIIAHPGKADDATFPAEVTYGAQAREDEHIFLVDLIDEIRRSTV